MFSGSYDFWTFFSEKEGPAIQQTFKTPAEYLNQIDNGWRRDTLIQLRTMIRNMAPRLEESIRNSMLCYRDQKGILFHLNIQKKHVSLYVGDAKTIDRDSSLLTGLDVGQSCIRFKKTMIPAQTHIESFIARSIASWQRGVTTSGALAVIGQR